jgi:hypothetical protein
MTTPTDFRALCAELLEALENAIRIIYGEDGTKHISTADAVITKADAALAQPEPEGPTEHDIAELAEDIEWKQLPQDEATRPSFLLEFARAVLTRYPRPTIEPVAVSERLPEPGKKVIAYYLNALGNSRTILAEWVPAKTKADDGLTDDDFAEYDEESDEYYWPEGWYEVIENWDDYGAVFVNEGEITHWRPLPPGPHHALPLPQP